MIRNCSIVVVGAGAAGMAATAKLLSSGFSNVTVLEASSRIGGRIKSIPFGPYTIDMGAQWVHGEKDNIVYEMASEADAVAGSEFSVVEMLCANSSGHIVDMQLSRAVYTVFYRIHEQFGDEKNLSGSFGDYFIAKFNVELAKDNIVLSDELKQSFIANLEQFENSVDAADSWFETSAPGLQQYEECDGNPLVRWKSGGYNSVFKLIDDNFGLKGVPSSSKVQFGKEVTSIEWDQDKGRSEGHSVTLRCSDGSQLTADHVIVAVSLGVLKHTAASVFKPELPSYKQIAIKALGFGTVNKIFLRFPNRWWPEELKGFNLLWTSQDRESQEYEKRNLAWAKDVFGFFVVDELPDMLCGWIVGKSAREMEKETDQTVLDVSYELLTRFFGKKFDIPKPTAISRSQWYSNPFTRGSYSFRTVDSQNVNASAAQLSQPVVNKLGKQVLFFAGEATHPYFYSTVHGALETGLREANRLASIYSFGENPSEVKSVVVVGAGIAGLAACRTLLDHGITDIVLLEGQNRPGGRIMSVPIQDGDGGWAELGAQWIHGEQNAVHALARDGHLLSDHVSAEGLGKYLYDDGTEIEQAVVHEVEGVVGDILEHCEQFWCDRESVSPPPESVGHYLCHRFHQYLDECHDSPQLRQIKMDLFDWHIRFQVIDNSCDDLHDLSAKFWGCYKFSGGRDYVNFINGYSTLIDKLVGDLPADVLRLNSAVDKIHSSENYRNCLIQQESLREENGNRVESVGSLIGAVEKIIVDITENDRKCIAQQGSDVSVREKDGSRVGNCENGVGSSGRYIGNVENEINSDVNGSENGENKTERDVSEMGNGEDREGTGGNKIGIEDRLKDDESVRKNKGNIIRRDEKVEESGTSIIDESKLKNGEGRIENDEILINNGEITIESGSMINIEENGVKNVESMVQNLEISIKNYKNGIESDGSVIKVGESNIECEERVIENDGIGTKYYESVLLNEESIVECDGSAIKNVGNYVSRIENYKGDNRTMWPISVICENNVQYRTSHVIVTSSLGYLKRNHESLFSPSLPKGLVKAIETMGFNVINKIFLIYKEPWWSKDEKGFQIMWRGKQNCSLNHKEYWMRSLTGFDVLSNFDNVLLGWVGGRGAVEMEALSEEEISLHCTSLLARLTRRSDLPKPAQVIRSQWHSNRFVCGGYSHTTSRCDQTCGPESLQAPVFVESALSSQHPAILLAGEATHEEYFSTTHGAYESGVRQAYKIIAFINENKNI
ncbi:uncharacterized protein LOC111063254 isoform X2 [Nilaparvata lugens]|uniref:uncharacterized protein LOC111063254 isoform X2 n=1 Tax=Nilaparvata lugens TaxID=108931 RepID=UPI00193CBC66|nr:uncharacterized protein LOC111063254 isoform X2 [Nilaparvata lugens]